MNPLFENLKQQLNEEKANSPLKSKNHELNDQMMKAVNDFLFALRELDVDVLYTLTNYNGFMSFAIETTPRSDSPIF